MLGGGGGVEMAYDKREESEVPAAKKGSGPTVRRLLLLGFVLGIVNFLAFGAISEYLGGDALNGHVINGHYFLGSHGHYTEVSQKLFQYSRWHATSIFVTHPIGALCAVALGLAKRFRIRLLN
jgi:hypothetical protein